MNLLITGSSGMIGTRLAERLVGQRKVVGVDIRPNAWNEAVDKLTIRADLREPAAYANLPATADIIVHLAANPGVVSLVADPLQALDNIVMLYHLLEYARRSNIRRVLFASSREVYGEAPAATRTEDEAFVHDCESPYTASKFGGEAILHAYRRCFGIEPVILRFSNVYGMYDDSDRLIPRFLRQATKNEPLEVYGREKMMDFAYIDDIVDGIVLAIDKFGTVIGGTFNLAFGESHTILSVARLVKEFLRSASEIVVGENRTGEIMQYEANIDRARAELGFSPRVPLEDGLRAAIAWYDKRNFLAQRSN